MDRTDDDNLGCGQCDDATNDYNDYFTVDKMDDDNPDCGQWDDATNDHIVMTLLAMGSGHKDYKNESSN